ncbi:DNA helicase [Handroanthus impetiginosus]|uniref:DNA helicase n=1 Tax=Handroanthus impetiginosus TaxID=429701 RepID=A0A2G9I484_9LAMI|nr:DNA helicase [Handroanthus impetiginosus]
MAIDITNHELPCDTHNTYDVYFFNDNIYTTVTNDPATVTDWISVVKSVHRRRLHSLIVGLDVEWRPSFSRHYQNPVATLQLCVGRRCLIFQLIHSNYVPDSLADFISENSYTFVGVGIKSDLEKLEKDYGIGGDAHAVDLGKLAAAEYDQKELKNVGLKGLASFVLGKEMAKPKGVTVSRWDERWLTNEQVKYACVDAFVSFEIGRILNASDF